MVVERKRAQVLVDAPKQPVLRLDVSYSDAVGRFSRQEAVPGRIQQDVCDGRQRQQTSGRNHPVLNGSMSQKDQLNLLPLPLLLFLLLCLLIQFLLDEAPKIHQMEEDVGVCVVFQPLFNHRVWRVLNGVFNQVFLLILTPVFLLNDGFNSHQLLKCFPTKTQKTNNKKPVIYTVFSDVHSCSLLLVKICAGCKEDWHFQLLSFSSEIGKKLPDIQTSSRCYLLNSSLFQLFIYNMKMMKISS